MTSRFKADILIVDDIPANLQLLVSYLSSHGYRVRAASDGRLGLMAARASKPDLILLDAMMPEFDGFQVCRELKNDGALSDVPVIFISAADDVDSKVKGFDAGGADYISKPFQFAEVLARIEAHLTIYYQRLEIEKAREQDRLYFESVSKLKDDFMSTASHDLKNPLHNIKLSTDLLAILKPESVEKKHYYIDNIKAQVDIMQQLINNILELLRLETGHALTYKPVSFARFVERITAEFQLGASAKKINLTMQTGISAGLCLTIDEDQMSQVLRNLLSNALKYTGEGGKITVRTTLDKARHMVQVDVEDNGLGIPKDDLEHIFEKFYRVQDAEHVSVEGTGLGLAICQTIVLQHGGEIGVESELGFGSTFFVRLPLPS